MDSVPSSPSRARRSAPNRSRYRPPTCGRSTGGIGRRKAAASQTIDPSAVTGELDQTEDGAEAALQEVTIVAGSARTAAARYPMSPGQCRHRPRCHSITRMASDASRKDRLVRRQQRTRNRESFERRSAKRRSAGNSEHPSDVNERPKGAMTELELSRDVRHRGRSRHPGRT